MLKSANVSKKEMGFCPFGGWGWCDGIDYNGFPRGY